MTPQTINVLRVVIKMQKYKRPAWRRRYQRKVFGMAEHEVLTLKNLVLLIDKVCEIREAQ